MRERIRGSLSYSNVMSTLCFFLLLSGGAAYAAGHLGKNTVGPKQLKKNAVTTAKIKKQAVTAAKVKNGTLTGTQINVSTLGTVPSAQTANSLSPTEGWHEIGTPGNPGFLNNWHNAGGPFETAAYFKDHDGIVHLKGFMTGGTAAAAFVLPPGFRPGSGKGILIPMSCVGGPCTTTVASGSVIGSNFPTPGISGAVQAPAGSTAFGLNGVTFRADS
ncbi:MAG TPA: hypothetical protein VH476_02830 [Solirubrobacterales bacterium]|jgi:hypothetical protein